MRLLSDLPGVSGNESPVLECVRQEFEKLTDEVQTDHLGNVLGIRRSSAGRSGRPHRVMVAAHVDEIGMMVRHVDANGFVKFNPVGGLDPRVLIAQQVIIHGSEEVRGIIAPDSRWLFGEGDKSRTPDIPELFIDVGRPASEVKRLVRRGDFISLAQPFYELNDQVVVSRNFDNRVGVYIMIEAMRRLKRPVADVFAVGTVQEEVGLRGATVAAYAIEPDIGIALDGSLTWDVPGAAEENRHCSMGKGVGIYVMDRNTISDRRIVDLMIGLCEQNDIPYQLNLGGGTDAAAMQRARGGAYACTIGPPVRYMHSVVQMCDRGDIEATVRLLTAFLESEEMIASLPVKRFVVD